MVESAFTTTTFCWINIKLWSKHIFWPRFLAFYQSFIVAHKHTILWLEKKKKKNRKTRKKWKELATSCNVLVNNHKIFDFQTLTKLILTDLTDLIHPSNVPVLLCWHQLRSLWATSQYQCDLFLQPQRVECPSKYRKEKQRKSIVI